MSLSVLVLPGQWEIVERVYKTGDAVALGEGYRQSFKGLNQRRSWDVSTVGMAHRINAAHQQLMDYQGDRGFLWSPDGGPDNGGSIPLAAYRCRSWELAQVAPGVLGLAGIFESATGGECEAYRPLIDVAAITPIVAGAIGWLSTASTAAPLTLGAHCRSATAAKLIAVLARASVHPALSEATKATAKAESLRLASTAHGQWFGGPPPGPLDRLWAPHAAITNQAQWNVGPSSPIASVSGVHGHIAQCNYDAILLPADAVTIADWAVGTTAAPPGPSTIGSAGRHWIQSTQTGSPMPSSDLSPPWAPQEVTQPGRYPVLYLVRIKAGASGGGGGVLERISPDGTINPSMAGDAPGLVKLDTNGGYWGPVIISFGKAIGPQMQPGQPMSLRPFGRMAAPWERDLDPEAIWAWCNAFEQLQAIDPTGPWAGSLAACRQTALAICDYQGDNSPVYWSANPAIEALGWPGAGHRSLSADGSASRTIWSRHPNGLALFNLGPTSEINAHASWWNTVTEARFGDTSGAVSQLTIELRASKKLELQIGLSASAKAGLTGKFHKATDYYCPLVLAAPTDLQWLQNRSVELFTVTRRSFIRWTDATLWHWHKYQSPWLFDPYWEVPWPGPGATATVNPVLTTIDGMQRLVAEILLDSGGSYSGVDLRLANTGVPLDLESPPAFCYRMVNLDANGNEISGGPSARFAGRNYALLQKFELPPTGDAWVVKQYEWGDRLPWSGGNDTATDWGVGLNEADGWTGFRVETAPSDVATPIHRCKIQVWWVGAAPDELPAEQQVYRLTLSSDEASAYDLAIGDIKGTVVGGGSSGPARSGVGAALHGATIDISKPANQAIVSARAGALYPADQNPWALYNIGPGRWEQARSQLGLIAEAQTAYSRQSPAALGGPIAPALRVAWWAEPALPPLSPWGPALAGLPDNPNATINSFYDRGNGGGYLVWGWAGYEPAHALSDGLLSYKAAAAAAQVWGDTDRLGLPNADRAMAKAVTLTMLRWIDTLRNQSGSVQVPTTIPQTAPPTVSILDAHTIALCLKMATWANLAGGPSEAGLTYRLCVALQGALLDLYEDSVGASVPWAAPGALARSEQARVEAAIEATDALLLLAAAKPSLSVPPCSVPMGPR